MKNIIILVAFAVCVLFVALAYSMSGEEIGQCLCYAFVNLALCKCQAFRVTIPIVSRFVPLNRYVY